MTTNLNIRVDKDLKENADKLFDSLGLNMTTAMNVFLHQCVREQAIPFRIQVTPQEETPNAETRAALEELQAERKKKDKKTYNSFSELLAEVSADV
jgi:DNA-damage-inducible protein J